MHSKRNEARGKIMQVTVRELEAGDMVLNKGSLVYTVLEIDKWEDGQTATVEWIDGGRDHRAWDKEHLEQVVQIARVPS